ncbi:MAG: DUF4956 domain-containing protein [Crocinitomicaceae bacterium]|nr:DUF4956 domain-containing protein [Crocinitomicaceae bacterium]
MSLAAISDTLKVEVIEKAKEKEELVDTLFGLELFNEDFYSLLLRFIFNMIVLTIIIRFIYYPKTLRKDYLFTYYMISITSFVLCFALKKLDIDTGMGLGLFAIFGIIRYRTNTMRIKEMTYLFVSIGLSVVNALSGGQVSYAEVSFINVIVILVLLFLEYVWFQKTDATKVIMYEKIENIKPENYDLLVADLEKRLGLKIVKAQVGKVDFLKDTAQVKIFFKQSEQEQFFPEES